MSDIIRKKIVLRSYYFSRTRLPPIAHGGRRSPGTTLGVPQGSSSKSGINSLSDDNVVNP